MIPKVIHYCWFGGNPIDDKSKKCMESWKIHCKDYRIIEWNESNFDVNCNPYVHEAYDSQKWAFVTDYVRLFCLYNYGGIYMDTDVELIKPLDSLLSHGAFSGFEYEDRIPTGIIAGEKKNPWLKHLLAYYDDRHFILPNGNFDTTTNVTTITNMTKELYPIALNNTFQDFHNELVIYPKDYFCPKSYESGKIHLTKNTFCIHHFNGSWHTEAEKRNRKKTELYYRLFGKKITNKILTAKYLSKRTFYHLKKRDGSFWGALKKYFKKIT